MLARLARIGARLDQLAAHSTSTCPAATSRLPWRYSARRADVVPVAVRLVDVEGDVAVEEGREHVEGEVGCLHVGEVVEDLRAERVDHAVRQVGERLGGVGLLLKALNASVRAGDDHAVLLGVGDLLHRERREAVVLLVSGRERGEVDVGQRVARHDEERLVAEEVAHVREPRRPCPGAPPRASRSASRRGPSRRPAGPRSSRGTSGGCRRRRSTPPFASERRISSITGRFATGTIGFGTS